jgi:hypothetical protein
MASSKLVKVHIDLRVINTIVSILGVHDNNNSIGCKCQKILGHCSDKGTFGVKEFCLVIVTAKENIPPKAIDEETGKSSTSGGREALCEGTKGQRKVQKETSVEGSESKRRND